MLSNSMRTLRTSAALAAISMLASSSVYAAVATVDGVGGASTGDPTFPVSYATLAGASGAIVAVNTAPGDHEINITTPGPINEPAGLLFNQGKTITVNGFSSGTHLRITPSGIASGGFAAGVAIAATPGMNLTLNRLVITPATGAAGPVSARGLQIFQSAATDTNANITLNDVMYTSIYRDDHPTLANQPITDPFALPSEAATPTLRNLNLRSFNGGGANAVIEISNANSTPGSNVVINMNRSGVTFAHSNLAAATAAGLQQARTTGYTLNINGGCFFTYCHNSGIRTTAHASGSGNLKMNGTATNPIILYRNGWLRDTASTGRNEGMLIQTGANGQPFIADFVYAVENFQEGIEITAGTSATLRNVISARNQFDLGGLGAPNIQTAANLLIQGGTTVLLQQSTLFDNQGDPANDNAIRWNVAGGAFLTTDRVIIAGAGDQISFAAGTRTWTDNNTAVVTNGPDALDSTPVILGGNTRTTTFGTDVDPDFENTVFSATYTIGTGISVPSNYLSARATGLRGTRTVGALDIRGGNPNSPLPVSMSEFMVE